MTSRFGYPPKRGAAGGGGRFNNPRGPPKKKIVFCGGIGLGEQTIAKARKKGYVGRSPRALKEQQQGGERSNPSRRGEKK